MTQSINDMTWNELHTYVGTLVGDLRAKDETINQLTTGLRLPGYIKGYERIAGDRYVLIPLTKADLRELIIPTGNDLSIIDEGLEDNSGKLINIEGLQESNKDKIIDHVIEAIKLRLSCETTYSKIHSDALASSGFSFIKEVATEAVQEWFNINDLTLKIGRAHV